LADVNLADLSMHVFTFLEHFVCCESGVDLAQRGRFWADFHNCEGWTAALFAETMAMIPELVEVSNDLLAEFDEKVDCDRFIFRKFWRDHIKRLSTEWGPWRGSRKLAATDHFKGDFTFCDGLFARKMKINKKFDDHRKAAYGGEGESDIVTRLRRRTDELEESYRHSNEGMCNELFQPDNVESASCILEESCDIVKAARTTQATFFVLPDRFYLIIPE
jgi:hypothetical protein